MSVESQAVLAGHVKVEQIVRLLKAEISGKVTVRNMQRPEFKVVEFQRLDGSWTALNLFLHSWAAPDYADAMQGPTTLMTVEYTPQNFNLVRSIAAVTGGLVRKAAVEPWIEMEPPRH